MASQFNFLDSKEFSAGGLYDGINQDIIQTNGFSVYYLPTVGKLDDNVLEEFLNGQVDIKQAKKINVFPEDTSGYDNSEQSDFFSKFGMISLETINVFVSDNDLGEFYEDEDKPHCVGDILVFPSEKVFEVTGIEKYIPGINNTFVYKKKRLVWLLKLTPYNYNSGGIQEEDTNTVCCQDEVNIDDLFEIDQERAFDFKPSQDQAGEPLFDPEKTNNPVLGKLWE